MADFFNLQRFVEAQDDEIDVARAELRRGRKCGHWMWFVFPQMKGLGSSETANYYAISCRAEAEACLSHPVLGPRLIDCTELVNLVERRSAVDIFGYPDWLKFRSSMTLFAMLNHGTTPFSKALDKYFDGERDRRTFNVMESA
jgi:uncharacterized protein (DUF1810 family)